LDHPLHLAVADEVGRKTEGRAELLRDPACGGSQHLPLFVGLHRGRDTQLCKVDLLVVKSGQVRTIIEIEESGFIPTKICGKFLTSALATYFIHDLRPELTVPFADQVLFVQVLDGSKFLKQGTRKDSQADLIERLIRDMLPLKGSSITDYRLFLVSGTMDHDGLLAVGKSVLASLA
jgi:hypothetical protein